jgi:hypothetical protein
VAGHTPEDVVKSGNLIERRDLQETMRGVVVLLPSCDQQILESRDDPRDRQQRSLHQCRSAAGDEP